MAPSAAGGPSCGPAPGVGMQRGGRWAGLAGIATGAGVLSLTGVLLAGGIPPASTWVRSHHLAPVASGEHVQQVPATGGRAGGVSSGGGPQSTVGASGSGGPLRTSCRSVVHIGDSTSDGLVSAGYLPNRKQRLVYQYARHGVRTVHWEISGGRSIVETLDGQANAHTVAQQLIQRGYDGCWVLALGTNDTADLAVGSPVGLSTRIAQMMSVIGNQPVMWVNVISLLDSGPYSEADMQEWDQALLRLCPRYPNMRVYDWAAVAKPRWFISDGIHYTSAGYRARSRLIARALAEAFPAVSGSAQGHQPTSATQQGSPAASCVVH